MNSIGRMRRLEDKYWKGGRDCVRVCARQREKV